MTTSKIDFFEKLGGLTREEVKLPPFGSVFIKSLTIKEQEEFEFVAMNSKGEMNTEISIKSIMVIKSAEDEDGNKMFTMDDLESLSAMPSAPINKLFSVASRLNNVTQKDIDELKVK